MIKKQYFLKSCLFLLLSAVFYVSGEEKNHKSSHAQITNPTPENLKTYSGTCDDLQPITSFENFIVQMFSHLDDDCLYLMPANELSQKLGIDVLDRKDGQSAVDFTHSVIARKKDLLRAHMMGFS